MEDNSKPEAYPELVCDGGFGGAIGGGCRLARSTGGSISPKICGVGGMNEGGGGAEEDGGGGGAELGGGGISISPSITSGMDIILPYLGEFVAFPVPLILGSLKGGSTGTFGVGTANPCTPSVDVKCLTVGLERTLAVPDSGMAAESNISSRLPISLLISTFVSYREWFFRLRKCSGPFFMAVVRVSPLILTSA